MSSWGAIELLVVGTVVLGVIGGGLALTTTFGDSSVSSGVDVQIDQQFIVPQFDSINETDIRTSSPGTHSSFRTRNGTTLRVIEENVTADSLTVTVPVENVGTNRGTVRLSVDSSTTPFTIDTASVSESFANNSTFARTVNHTVVSDTDALVELPSTVGTEPRALNVTVNYESTPASPLTATFELSPTDSRVNIQPGDPLDGGSGNGDGGAGGGTDGGDGGAGGDGGSGGNGRLVFAQGGDVPDLRSFGQDREMTFSYGIEESVKALGPSIGDFDNDAAIEIPVVVTAPDQDGHELIWVDDSGDVSETRIGGVKSGRVAVGSFSGSPESVFFAEEDASGISRFTPETNQGRTEVTSTEAQAVAGIADIDGDNATELVFGGNSPSGSSGTVNYIDDDDSLEGTGVQYGSNNGAGVGRPADFDNDSRARIPIVNGDQKIALVDENSGSTVLTDGAPAKKAPIATTDWDDDGALEIMFLANGDSGRVLKYIDDVTGSNEIRVPVDDDGNTFTDIHLTAGLSGGQRATVQTQTASRTNADARTQVVYKDANGDLAARNESGPVDTPTVSGSIKATGSPVDLTGGPSEEYPVVLSDNSGTLKLNGSGTALTTDIKTQPLAVRSSVSGPGQFAIDSPSIFYARSSDSAIRRITPGGPNMTYDGVSARIVAGPADIDGDNAAELVFGGNSPSGNSDTVSYIDDDGSLEGLGVGYGSDDSAGVGQPADFDNDGIARVPIVNGDNEIALVDAAGRETIVADNAKKSAPAVVDYDDDSTLEIVYISLSGELNYIDNVTSDNSVETVGSGIDAKPEAGVR